MIFFSNNFRPQLVMITMLTCSLVSMQAASGKEDANTPHWAFQPLRESKAASVDEFTEPALAAQHLTLGPQAGKRELIRRVTYDLTGLPPAVGEITSFLQDEAPGAMNRVIERLLASPHYGERWARWWLDVARYADSNGRDENIFFGNAWRYRDWTIRAFNENLPFDSFITDQLAGDLMSPEGASISQRWDRLTATGFLAMGCKNLAEQDKTKMVMDMVDEQIDMVSRALLGLTVSCARCHDHKFDPISTRDYYALAGIFHSTKTMANLEFVSKTNERPMATAAEIAARKAHDQQSAVHTGSVNKAVEVANAALVASWMKMLPEILTAAGTAHEPVTKLPPTALSRLRDLMSEDSPTHPECQTLHRLASQAETIPDFLKQAALLPTLPRLPVSSGITGCSPRVDPVSLHNFLHSTEPSTSQFTVETWVRLNELPARAESRIWLVHQGEHPWEKGHYGLMLEGDHVAASMNLAGGPTQRIFLKCKTDSLDAAHWHHVAMTYDGTALRLFFNGDQVGKSEVTVPRVPKPSELGLGRSLDEVRQFNGNVVETRVYAEALPLPTIKKHHDARSGAPMAPDDTPGWNISELQQPDAAASANAMTYRALFGPRGILTLPSNPRPFYPAETSASIAALEKVRDDFLAKQPQVPRVLAVEEGHAHDLPVHLRGSHLDLELKPVPRGFIPVVSTSTPPSIPAQSSGRLELAHWLTTSASPLCARVIVNRIWQAHFGQGLVRSPDNFGRQGEPPSHPELLDWLARELISSGWDVKHLHRLILTSAAWQQTQHVESAAAETADPENRLLWHFPRLRLEAEMLRDSLLAVSGRLDPTVGGSIVSWNNMDYTPPDKVSPTSLRRSIYLPVVRDRVYDAFTIFDFANPSIGTSQRTATVVSHQALFFLNSPLVKECSRSMAVSLLQAAPDNPESRVTLAYQRACARLPGDREKMRALNFIDSIRNSPHQTELGAWTAWCQMLFAANEFLYLD